MEDPVKVLRTNLREATTLEELSSSVKLAEKALGEAQGQRKALLHAHLCKTVIESSNELISFGNVHSELLFSLSYEKAFEVVVNNISNASPSVSRWLEGEIIKMINEDGFKVILRGQCLVINSQLSVPQKNLIKSLTHLPDIIASRRQRQASSQLHPLEYFSFLANTISDCLDYVCITLRKSQDCSVTFLASLVAKAATLGHKESFWGTLCPKLEEMTVKDPLWSRVSQKMFGKMPQHLMEVVLDGLMEHTAPSLRSPSILWYIIGDLPLTNDYIKHLLTHKYTTLKPIKAIHNLVGYLNSNSELRPLLVESLLVSLKLWCDKCALRHVTESLHTHICGVIILIANCIRGTHLKCYTKEIEQLAIEGIQVHIESNVNCIKHNGMVTGEYIMNHLLHPSNKDPLKFSYPSTPSIVWLKSLMRDIDEQEKELREQSRKYQETISSSPQLKIPDKTEDNQMFGQGMARTNEAINDSDDDDLQPFDMSNDRDSTQSASPINLRQCLKGILCRDDASKHTTALRSIKLLVQSKSSDLKEVCVELVKVLIHLDDIFPMDDFLLVKLEAMVELTTACPNQVCIVVGINPVTPFLCEQFYFPNYTILQRMNILESLTGAAVKLSTPVKDHEIKEYTISSVSSSQVKPWQKVVEERIKSKTRIISTKREQRVDGAANRFSDVCGMFFFPLMVNYDTKVNTLDLLGKDSLLLGQLLNTLGTVVHLAVHSPLVPVMASTLVEFCWLFKYHTEISVRQGVLYCVSCLLSSLPSSSLPLLIDKGLHEMMLWVKDVTANDANQQCRHLANMSLSLYNELCKSVQ